MKACIGKCATMTDSSGCQPAEEAMPRAGEWFLIINTVNGCFWHVRTIIRRRKCDFLSMATARGRAIGRQTVLLSSDQRGLAIGNSKFATYEGGWTSWRCLAAL